MSSKCKRSRGEGRLTCEGHWEKLGNVLGHKANEVGVGLGRGWRRRHGQIKGLGPHCTLELPGEICYKMTLRPHPRIPE